MSDGSATLSAWKRWRPLHDGLARDIHPDRWAALGVPAGAAEKLTACARSARTISLDPGFLVPGADCGWNAWEAENGTVGADWALLPGAVLWRTALRFGAGRHHAEIARLVWRRDVDALKSVIGDDAHRFALRQAPALRRRFPPSEAVAEGGLAEAVVGTARLGLGCCLAGLPPGMAGRVLAKLPPRCDGMIGEAQSWPEDRRGRWAANLAGLFAAAPAPVA